MKAQQIIEAAKSLNENQKATNLQGNGFFINITMKNDGTIIARHSANITEQFPVLDAAGQIAFNNEQLMDWANRSREKRENRQSRWSQNWNGPRFN